LVAFKPRGFWFVVRYCDSRHQFSCCSCKYGPQALQIATTVKLARALWIIPVALITAIFYKNKTTKIKIPYFIALFILAMILNTYLPQTALVAPYLVSLAKTGLTVTLF
jgi:uncharacterized membrane protein YadS